MCRTFTVSLQSICLYLYLTLSLFHLSIQKRSTFFRCFVNFFRKYSLWLIKRGLLDLKCSSYWISHVTKMQLITLEPSFKTDSSFEYQPTNGILFFCHSLFWIRMHDQFRSKRSGKSINVCMCVYWIRTGAKCFDWRVCTNTCDRLDWECAQDVRISHIY